MNRKQLLGATLLAAASLIAMGAGTDAQAQQGKADKAANGAANAADKAGNAADKAGNAADKAGDKANKAADKAADKAEKAGEKADKAEAKANSAEARADRKAKQHDAQREKLKSMLKGPMDEALKQELRRHAERVAKLERIQSVATTEKDKTSDEKATKLLAKENERHEKWMSKHSEGTMGVNTPPSTTDPNAATPAVPAGKDGGAK
jgi:bacterioferritin (cytochrome b1)